MMRHYDDPEAAVRAITSAAKDAFRDGHRFVGGGVGRYRDAIQSPSSLDPLIDDVRQRHAPISHITLSLPEHLARSLRSLTRQDIEHRLAPLAQSFMRAQFPDAHGLWTISWSQRQPQIEILLHATNRLPRWSADIAQEFWRQHLDRGLRAEPSVKPQRYYDNLRLTIRDAAAYFRHFDPNDVRNILRQAVRRASAIDPRRTLLVVPHEHGRDLNLNLILNPRAQSAHDLAQSRQVDLMRLQLNLEANLARAIEAEAPRRDSRGRGPEGSLGPIIFGDFSRNEDRQRETERATQRLLEIEEQERRRLDEQRQRDDEDRRQAERRQRDEVRDRLHATHRHEDEVNVQRVAAQSRDDQHAQSTADRPRARAENLLVDALRPDAPWLRGPVDRTTVTLVGGAAALRSLAPEQRERLLQAAIDRAHPVFAANGVRGNFYAHDRGGHLALTIVTPRGMLSEHARRNLSKPAHVHQLDRALQHELHASLGDRSQHPRERAARALAGGFRAWQRIEAAQNISEDPGTALKYELSARFATPAAFARLTGSFRGVGALPVPGPVGVAARAATKAADILRVAVQQPTPTPAHAPQATHSHDR